MTGQHDATEFNALIVQQVMANLEEVFANERIEDMFEIEDKDLAEGLKRFQKLFDTDRDTALAGMLASVVMTADLFEDILTQLGKESSGNDEEE